MNYWMDELKDDNKLELYKVSIEGNLYKFDENFLPDDSLTYEEKIKMAKKYWESENTDSNNNEYLFQRKIKIIKKLNMKDII